MTTAIKIAAAAGVAGAAWYFLLRRGARYPIRFSRPLAAATPSSGATSAPMLEDSPEFDGEASRGIAYGERYPLPGGVLAAPLPSSNIGGSLGMRRAGACCSSCSTGPTVCRPVL